KQLSDPGPLIRVPVGTEVRATLRNRLPQPLIVYGFGKTRGISDSVIIAPNAVAPLSFRATTAGTFYYLATRGVDPVGRRPLDHPMHLHGFYFRMDSKGDGVTDSLYSSAERRMAVTEMINPFQTMSLSWYADRPGNWIYHCHYATHLSTLVALDTEDGMLDRS